jgi:hypothetical protein
MKKCGSLWTYALCLYLAENGAPTLCMMFPELSSHREHELSPIKTKENKPGGDRVHVCVMGLKWGHTGVVHVASLP